MTLQKLKIAHSMVEATIDILSDKGAVVKQLQTIRDDLEEEIESNSISVFSKLNKLNDEQRVVYNKWLEIYEEEPDIYETIVYFEDRYRTEFGEEVKEAFKLLSTEETNELIENLLLKSKEII